MSQLLCSLLMTLIIGCRPEHASLSQEDSSQSSQSTSTSSSSRSRSLPQQVRRMSNSFLTRLRSQVRQQGLQAEAAASVLGRPKTPVQYVRVPAGPTAPLPNPFAGVPESSQPSTLQASLQTAQQAESSGMQAQVPHEGQPLQQASAAKQKAAKSAKWEMLLEPDEPEEPAQAEPSALEQSAPSAAQPKMAMRFQMMIDSQELESKRQQRNPSQGPSLSAAVYPEASPRQGSTRQQGHHSMPPLLSTLGPSKQQHRPKPKPWELLLAAQDPQAVGSTPTTAAHSQQQGTSRPQSDQHRAQAPDQEQAKPGAVDHTQMIARWERMLDKRSSQQSASSPASAAAGLDRQPSQRVPGPAPGKSSLHQLGPQQSLHQMGALSAQQHAPQAEASRSAAGAESSQAPLALEISSKQASLPQARRAAHMPLARPAASPAVSRTEHPQSSSASTVPRMKVADEPEQIAQTGMDLPEKFVEEGEQSDYLPIPLEDRDKVPPLLCAACCLPRALWLPSKIGKASHPCILHRILQVLVFAGQHQAGNTSSCSRCLSNPGTEEVTKPASQGCVLSTTHASFSMSDRNNIWTAWRIGFGTCMFSVRYHVTASFSDILHHCAGHRPPGKHSG